MLSKGGVLIVMPLQCGSGEGHVSTVRQRIESYLYSAVREGGGGGLLMSCMTVRSRMVVDPRIRTMPGWGISIFHRPFNNWLASSV